YIIINGGTVLIGQVILWFTALKYIDIKPKFDFVKIRDHIIPIFVLFLPQILGQVYLSVDKILLNYYRSETEVGYYDQAIKIIKILLTIITSISAVMLPSLSAEFVKGNREKIMYYVEIIFQFILFISIPMIIVISSISNNFITWFLGMQFLEVASLLKIISPIILFIGLGSLFGTQILVATNQINKLTISIACGAVISVLINVIFVPLYGIYATAVATLLSEITVTTVQYFFVQKFLNFKNISKSFVLYIVSATAMFGFIVIIEHTNIESVIKIIIQGVLGLILYFLVLTLYKEKLILFLIDQVGKKIFTRIKGVSR
ncbi:polysaccharide biosynthesis C-terminal domain-containing protein, partial [Paenibacillus sp. NPDC056579]|uniref:oligosaccharide flippase family protein n=1 Tax=Paenibacillus sp. NPDC056579 TaxID=3345871 RepID=UPI0036A578BB